MVTIRPSVRGDIEAVLRLWARSRSSAATIDDTAAAIHGLLERDPGALIVAERSGRVVGALIAGFDGWRGSMYRLVVEPEMRRQGIATRLVAAGESRLRRLGAVRVTALAADRDPAAHGLWDAAGYDHDRAVARFVKNL